MGFRRMGWHELLWVGRLLVLMQLLHGVFGWGKDGHFAVCKIADDVRWHCHWSSPLHYVDALDFKCNYKYCSDCHDTAGHKDSCVTGALI
uniref:Aspergillus nuclease S1 n=1 Tax=Gossypium raimondii TaxID=29730 RepID=A0A0D2W873_GOSRA|nr:hypothetical protein B456_013G213400 [Gossypium raimondii]